MLTLRGYNKKAISLPTALLLSIILISTVFLCPILLMLDASTRNKGTTESAEIRLSSSGSTSLDPGDYYYEYKHVRFGIKWSFEGSLSSVGILVAAMDQDQYNKYVFYGQIRFCRYYVLSDGSYWRDSGTFAVPNEDVWYILFINSGAMETSLSYNVMFEQVNPLYIIIAVIIAVLIIGLTVAILLNKGKTRKPKITVSQSIVSPQPTKHNIYKIIANENGRANIATPPTLKQNWLVCTNCGERIELPAYFCPNCGGRLDD